MPSKLLTDIKIKASKPTDKLYKLNDGDGLRLVIHPNTSRYWQWRYHYQGKEKTLQIGKYPLVSLSQARELAIQARKQLDAGLDPVLARRIEKAKQATLVDTTFMSVAQQWLEIKQRTLAASTYARTVASFEANIYPLIGKLPIAQVTSPMIRGVLQVMEKRGALDYMWRLRALLRAVFGHALNEGLITQNPVTDRDDVLRKHQGTSYPTLRSAQDIGQFLRVLADYPGRQETRLAIWLQMLVATRPGELRQAEWAEFDLDKALWTLPISRMKTRKHMEKPHVVALSRQAIEALKELKEYTGHSKLLFPGVTKSDRPVTDMALSMAIRRIWPQYRVVPEALRAKALPW